jgi:hypothetical protein
LVVRFLWLVQSFTEQLQAAVTEEPGVGGIGQSDRTQG